MLLLLVAAVGAGLPSAAVAKTARAISTRTLLHQLMVVPKHSAGFSHAKFGRLVDADHDRCNTRAEVFIAEAVVAPRIKRGCRLVGGKWVSPYDGATTTDPTRFGIDHVVALGEAWQSGAWQWSTATRNAYLNDLGYAPSLVAVSMHSLRDKGDGSPMTWLPSNKHYRCTYLASWVAVKWRWQLAVNGAERAFLERKLATCGWPTVRTPQRAKVAAVLCQDFEHLNVTGAHDKHYQLLNIRYHTPRRICLENGSNGDNFTVTNQLRADPRGKVGAYPEIFRGCLWTGCSYRSGMPIRVSKIGHPVSTWHTHQGARGDWNAAYELWFGRHAMTTGQADGAELMIWLNRHGTCCHLIRHVPTVRIDGHRFYLMHWRPCSRKWRTCFNYIQFRLVHPTWRVDNLHLAPFIRKAERLKLVRPWWFLENVGAGFEIWKGGRGLRTTRFDMRM
jgi:hypothetical protein